VQPARSIFRSPHISNKWKSVERELTEVIQIEDLKTPGVNPGDRRALFYIVTELHPRRVLEVGTNVGASTGHIAIAMRDFGQALVTVDLADVNDKPDSYWRNFDLRRSPRDNIAKIGMADKVTFVTADSVHYMREEKSRFDLIFLDGDHTAEGLPGRFLWLSICCSQEAVRLGDRAGDYA
jgi:predicted O-methyltransferase YrrM